MQSDIAPGSVLILLAGVCQGSFMAPAKAIRSWAWENYWLVFAITAYLICPWVLAFTTIPRLLDVYGGTPMTVLALVVCFGIGWGIGALTFGLGIEALGLSLGFAIILGTSALIGTIVPLIATEEAHSAGRILATAGWLTLMLIGVVVCSLAGKWKEANADHPRSYARGLTICLASGLLSGCSNLGFFFGRKLSERAHFLGAPDYSASNAIWTLLTFPLFFCNAGYALYLLRRNRTGQLYRSDRSVRDFGLALSMGILWMAGFSFYGAGARRLGELGPSLGWAMMMSTVVLVANGLGIATGEWVGAPSWARRQLALGLLLLVGAICGLGFVNR